MLIQVHDEPIFDMYKTEKIFSNTCKRMENAFKLKVPLTVALGIGDNARSPLIFSLNKSRYSKTNAIIPIKELPDLEYYLLGPIP